MMGFIVCITRIARIGLWAFLVMPTARTSSGIQIGDMGEAEAFFVRPHILAQLADSTQIGYRFRELKFACDHEGGQMLLLQDGILKLSYELGSFSSEEYYQEREPDSGYMPIDHLRTLYLSLLSGQSVMVDRSQSRASPDATVGLCKGIPGIFFYARGYVSGGVGEPFVVEDSGDGTVVMRSTDTGVALIFELDAQRRLRRFRAVSPDGVDVSTLTLSEYSSDSNCSVALPAWVSKQRFDLHGCLLENQIWARITGPWTESTIDTDLPSRTNVIDLRVHSGVVIRAVQTDRPMSPEEVLCWPGLIGKQLPPDTKLGSNKMAEPETPFSALKYAALMLGVVVLLAGAGRIRNKWVGREES